jgi:hypothetical protein
MSDLTNSMRRVAALQESIHRESAIIRTMITAIGELHEELEEGPVRKRLSDMIDDCGAQVAACEDALNRALEDLPEGEGL